MSIRSGGWEAGAGVGRRGTDTVEKQSERPASEKSGGEQADLVGGDVVVQVGSMTLREALVGVGARGGWRLRSGEAAGSWVVSDEPSSSDGEHGLGLILAVEPSPSAAQAGLQALSAGVATAAFLSDDPSDLVWALEAVTAGWTAAPIRLLELASRMPELTERQVAVIRAVQAGQGNTEIAKGLYLSPASVKRELAGLFRSLGVDNRLSLAAVGTELGLTPCRLMK